MELIGDAGRTGRINRRLYQSRLMLGRAETGVKGQSIGMGALLTFIGPSVSAMERAGRRAAIVEPQRSVRDGGPGVHASDAILRRIAPLGVARLSGTSLVPNPRRPRDRRPSRPSRRDATLDRSDTTAHRWGVTTAALDRLLALLIAALVTTGLVTLRMGAEGEAWVFAVHGLLAAALAVTVAMKLGRSLPKAVRARRWGRVALGLVLSAATIAALVLGFAWVASGRLLTVASWTVLTVHAWIGLVLVPITVLHLLPRRWRLLRVPRRSTSRTVPLPRRVLTRRQLLSAGAIGGASLAIFGGAQVADILTGGMRRFTGSRWLPAGGMPPDTTFFGEAAPPIDAATWRLRVSDGAGIDVTYDLETIRALGEREQRAVLDCTSGWALETTWRGVPVAELLRDAGTRPDARSVIVRSATGWSTSLDSTELDAALLATSVGGGPLPLANGAPCRLVAPNRRGLDWVKWVTEVRVA